MRNTVGTPKPVCPARQGPRGRKMESEAGFISFVTGEEAEIMGKKNEQGGFSDVVGGGPGTSCTGGCVSTGEALHSPYSSFCCFLFF